MTASAPPAVGDQVDDPAEQWCGEQADRGSPDERPEPEQRGAALGPQQLAEDGPHPCPVGDGQAGGHPVTSFR
ncbi:hypothetical protein [Pseudonocardia sp. ICBG601]|uniref:hypothetical protein n=1 Tax=Pseudonocardia sp. ICBG601 TaxID=2846759 RepID=UPI0027E39E0E|nr:hypothetical protein [Pseudonocardia sp. ICBG601]